MKFFAVAMVILVADCSGYYTVEKNCRRESVIYMLPFFGGFLAMIACRGRSSNDYAE